MSVTVRDNIYSDIESQFPNVYKENSEFFIAFVEAYYQYLDEKNDRDIPKLRDIDTTIPTFFIYYKKKYLADLPINATVDVPFIIKHIDDLYTRKGTKESLELLFKLFFNEQITVTYPGGNVLRPSNSLWGGEAFLEMKSIFEVGEYPIQRGNTIKGDLSNAEAFVDDLVFVNFSGALTPIVFMSSLRGTFVADDSIEVISADENGAETVVNVGKLISGSISKVSVSKAVRLPNQRQGDTVDLVSKESGVGAKGIITKSSDTQVGSIDYSIIDGGYGYIKPGTANFEEQRLDISNHVIILKGDAPYDIEKGQTIVFPGSTVDHTTRGENPFDPVYSVNGSAVITDYRHPLLFIQTKTSKQDLFEQFTDYHIIQDTNDGSVSYRNLLFDSFYNAFLYRNNTFGNVYAVPASQDRYYKFLQQPTLPSDRYGGNTYSSYTGPDGSMNDATIPYRSFNLAELQFFLSYQFSVNNGLDDVEIYNAPTDADDWLSLDNAGEININALGNEVVDRLPTVGPLLPAEVHGVGADYGGIDDLNDGQVYTVVSIGTNTTVEDFAKIGCNKAIEGTDFTFTSANLSNLSMGGSTSHDRKKYDAVFTSGKMVVAKFLKFLQLVDLFNEITIGSAYNPPLYPDTVSQAYPATDALGNALPDGSPHPKAGQQNYGFYNQYLHPVNNLQVGHEYAIHDFGTTSFDDWNKLGAELDTRTEPNTAVNLNVSVAGKIAPLSRYMIQHLGTTTKANWEAIGWTANEGGAGSDPAPGDQFTAPDYTSDTWTIVIDDITTGSGGDAYSIDNSQSADSGSALLGSDPNLTMYAGDTLVFDVDPAVHATDPLAIRKTVSLSFTIDDLREDSSSVTDRFTSTGINDQIERGDILVPTLTNRYLEELPDGANGSPEITSISTAGVVTGTNLDGISSGDTIRIYDTGSSFGQFVVGENYIVKDPGTMRDWEAVGFTKNAQTFAGTVTSITNGGLVTGTGFVGLTDQSIVKIVDSGNSVASGLYAVDHTQNISSTQFTLVGLSTVSGQDVEDFTNITFRNWIDPTDGTGSFVATDSGSGFSGSGGSAINFTGSDYQRNYQVKPTGLSATAFELYGLQQSGGGFSAYSLANGQAGTVGGAPALAQIEFRKVTQLDSDGLLPNGSSPDLNSGTIQTLPELTSGKKYYVGLTYADDHFELYSKPEDAGGFDPATRVSISNADQADGVSVTFARDFIVQTDYVSGAGTDTVSFTPLVSGTYYYQSTTSPERNNKIEVFDKTPIAQAITVSGTGKVIDISLATKKRHEGQSITFNAVALSSGDSVSGDGVAVDIWHTKFPGKATNVDANGDGEPDTPSGALYYYTGHGMFSDPVRDASGVEVTSVPDHLTDTSFVGFIDGDYFNTIQCKSIGPYNATSSFEVTDVVDTEVIRLSKDIIGDHANEVLEPRTYFNGTDVLNGTFTITNHGFVDKETYIFEQGGIALGGIVSGEESVVKVLTENTFELYESYTIATGIFTGKRVNVNQNGLGHAIVPKYPFDVPPEYSDSAYDTSGVIGKENINTTLQDSFQEQTFTIGSIGSILENSPGLNYQNDVGVRVFNEIISQYDLRDLIITFDNPPFTLLKNDIVTQEIRSQYEGPIGDTEADYTSGALIPDTTNSVLFDRSVTTRGLEIVIADNVGGQQAVTDDFALKVAKTTELLIDTNGVDVVEREQRKLISILRGDFGTTHEGLPTAQRIAYGSGDAYTPNFLQEANQSSYVGYPNFLNSHETNDMIWYKPTGGPNPGVGDRDIEEVVEHLLHTIHLFGIPGCIENSEVEMNWRATENPQWETTELHYAMKEAINGGFFDPSNYASSWRTDPEDAEIAYKEYLYFLNWSMWAMSEFWDGSSKAPEWSDSVRTADGIEANNPLGYDLFNTYIAPVLNRPNFTALRSIFQDNDQGDPDYTATLETSYLSALEIRDLPSSSTLASIKRLKTSLGDITDPPSYAQSVTEFDLVEEKYTVKLKYLRRQGTEFYFRPMSFFGVDQSKPINIRAVERKMLSIRKDKNSLPMGSNAQILGAAEYSTGQLEEIKITHTGYKYAEGEEVDIINTTPNSPTYNQKVAQATLETIGQGSTEGKWRDKTSFLNENSARIHDNDYYQEYSYDISTMTDPDLYVPLVKDVVGVAGTKMFSTPLINSDNRFDSSIDVSITRFDVLSSNLTAEGIGHVGDPTESIDGDLLMTDPNADDILISVTQEENDKVV
jgi:hypothetical protein